MEVRVDLFDLPAFAPEHRGGPRECADKLVSEAAEAFAEVRGFDRVQRWDRDLDTHCGPDTHCGLAIRRKVTAFELADVLQVVRNICEVCGIGPDLMAEAMRACVEKNRAKDGGRYR